MKYLFKHPKQFAPTKFKKGDLVWIIEDELQEDGTYIDKVKQAEVKDVEPYWFQWYLINFWLFNYRIRVKLIKTYTQGDSYKLETDTLTRIASSDFEIFATKEEADNYFKENYVYEEDDEE